jgi:hypothetical protein
MTWKEFLANSKECRNVLFKRLSSKEDAPDAHVTSINVEDDEQRESRCGSKIPYVLPCPRVTAYLEGHKFKSLIDGGAEINVMALEAAKKLDIPYRSNPHINMVSYTGHKRGFVGVFSKVYIEIGGIFFTSPIFVVEKADHPVVLGSPFIYQTKLKLYYREGGEVWANLYPEDGGEGVSFRAVSVHESGKTKYESGKTKYEGVFSF